MVQAGIKSIAVSSVEEDLRAELAQSDLAIGSVGPVLRNLLANDDHSLFSDEIVARVRGMLSHLAWQLLAVEAEEAGASDPLAVAERHVPTVASGLADNTALLGHVHALALEWQLTERL